MEKCSPTSNCQLSFNYFVNVILIPKLCSKVPLTQNMNEPPVRAYVTTNKYTYYGICLKATSINIYEMQEVTSIIRMCINSILSKLFYKSSV